MVVAVTLSWALLVDALRWNVAMDNPTYHGKVSFIEGVHEEFNLHEYSTMQTPVI